MKTPTAARVGKAIRDGFDRHWLTILMLALIWSNSRPPAPPVPVVQAGLGNVQEVSAPEVYSMWGDPDAVSKGYSLFVAEKNNPYANTAFLLHPSLKDKAGVTPRMVQVNNQICTNYVRRFAKVARAEMRRFDIPASITLAQALLESDAGGSRLVQKANNHFGIKCFSRTCKKGHCTNFSDDTHKDFFRIYKNAWESFRAHSRLLSGKRYSHLRAFGKDYKKWAYGLQKAGYATDKHYAKKLITLIEALHLYEFDQ